MTIDEALKNCEYGSTFTDQEYDQLAEWLEELKAYKEKEFDVLKQDGQLLYKQGVIDGYNKAIDDFEKENIKRFLYSERERAEIHYIAEQLKEGEKCLL